MAAVECRDEEITTEEESTMNKTLCFNAENLIISPASPTGLREVTLLALDDGMYLEISDQQAEKLRSEYTGEGCEVVTAFKSAEGAYYEAKRLKV